jgi:C4-dicarboxylate-specific signal transduction histidine kinase
LATIGQLVAGVAHEINNPLAFLKSNLNSLKQEVADLRLQHGSVQLGEFDEIVAESIDGVGRIETLVQALKGTARNRNEKIRFDPARAVNEAVTIFRGAKKSECEIVCELTPLPEVLGSPSALGQVVLNLLQNGLDAMSTVERPRRKLELRAQLAGEFVSVTVRDYGTGIPLHVQARMYDAFFTTKGVGKGTGLGLSICKEIAEGLGGRLEFVSDGQGTTFELVIPSAKG